jgi:hypothetical protein
VPVDVGLAVGVALAVASVAVIWLPVVGVAVSDVLPLLEQALSNTAIARVRTSLLIQI